jgi:hypothetical protein
MILQWRFALRAILILILAAGAGLMLSGSGKDAPSLSARLMIAALFLCPWGIILLMTWVVRTWAGHSLLVIVSGTYLWLLIWCHGAASSSHDGMIFIVVILFGLPGTIAAAGSIALIDRVVLGIRSRQSDPRCKNSDLTPSGSDSDREDPRP